MRGIHPGGISGVKAIASLALAVASAFRPGTARASDLDSPLSPFVQCMGDEMAADEVIPVDRRRAKREILRLQKQVAQARRGTDEAEPAKPPDASPPTASVSGPPAPATRPAQAAPVLSWDQKLEQRIRQVHGAPAHHSFDFERFLHRELGGKPSFYRDGVEFDGMVYDVWYEAKSGGFWRMLERNQDKAADFQHGMTRRKRIAQAAQRKFVIFTNSPIPATIRGWLKAQEIPFHELLR